MSEQKPSKAVLINAARLLIESEHDGDFPIAEIMLLNILISRAAVEAQARLQRIPNAS